MARCPKTAEEAFKRLDKRISKGDKIGIRDSKTLSEYHFGLGLWIRNNWFYTGEPENVASLLKDLGLSEFLIGDDASESLLEAYQKHLKEIELGE